MAKKIFYPAIQMMNNLKYPQKMLLVAFIFSLPLLAFMYLLLVEINEGIINARKEKQGAEYNQSIMKFFQGVQQHRGMSNAYLNGDESFKTEIIIKQADLEADIKQIDSVESRFSALFQTSEKWEVLKEKWRNLQKQQFSLGARESFEMHTSLISDILALIAHVADISRLTLDTYIDIFYLIDVAANKLPLAIEYAAQIRGFGAGAIVTNTLSAEEYAHLIALTGLCRSTVSVVETDLKKAFLANKNLEVLLGEGLENSIRDYNDSLEMLLNRVINSDHISIEPSEYFAVFSDSINTSFKLHNNVTIVLNDLLQTRVDRLLRKRNSISLLALVSLVMLGYVFMGNYYSVVNALSKVIRATKRIGIGKLDVDLSVESKDEMLLVAQSLSEMTESLKGYTDELTSTNEALQREVSERKYAEEKVKKSAAELERSNTELEQFAYAASHDLKEPLLAIAVDLRLIQRKLKGLQNPDTDTLISGAIDGANRMQALISDLLSYSRAGNRGKPFAVSDCSDMLEQALLNLKVPLEESNAKVTYDELPEIMADSSQLVQLFQNLIHNAIKFRGKETPRIHVSAEQRERSWIFSVIDNGIGISPDQVEKIFEIFSRLHRDTYPGTGIGLATCKKIVEHHGGRIWVESTPGHGSVFFFTIPETAGFSP
ncbi:MAG: nitrate- and nitrite sensing domain-containing protein [Nitrospiraceae bacterium]|nr:MAG: nitrate- and nitrite sensing domain-containing protein [Nitrospiraceae bacterium]